MNLQVVYTAPNRAHHYRYAMALKASGCLCAFVSGFPRFNPRAKAPSLNGKLHHADWLQMVYLLSLKAKLPAKFCNWLAYQSKIEQDRACLPFVENCDIFLYYNGSGLNSSRVAQKRGALSVVEAVNSHVIFQEDILRYEHKELGIPWNPFPENEKSRRLQEYAEADYILLPSEFVRRSFLEKGFPPHKLLKVPYGFNLNTATLLSPTLATPDSFTVLFVGSISVRKGIRYLVEAFKLVKHPHKKLLIVGPNAGDGALDGVTLCDQVVFTGILKGAELAAAYRSASVFCLPTLEEGLALVQGEALSYGLPLITTTNSGAEDIITDGAEGFIVPIKNSKAIAEKLNLLADDPVLLGNMRENAWQQSKLLGGWETCGNNLVTTLNTLKKV